MSDLLDHVASDQFHLGASGTYPLYALLQDYLFAFQLKRDPTQTVLDVRSTDVRLHRELLAELPDNRTPTKVNVTLSFDMSLHSHNQRLTG